MSRRERQRANRHLKRQAEHQQRMAKRHERISEQAREYDHEMFERISMKVENGKHTDPTAYLAVEYARTRISEEDRIYVFSPRTG